MQTGIGAEEREEDSAIQLDPTNAQKTVNSRSQAGEEWELERQYKYLGKWKEKGVKAG